MWDRNPVRLALVHMLPEIAGRSEVALGPLLSRAGLAPGTRFDTESVASRSQVCTLLQQLARRTGEPTIGLDLAGAADPARLAMLGRGLFSGRTLRECLLALARNSPSLQAGVEFRLEERNGMARWYHRLNNSDAEHAAVLNEGITAFVMGAMKAIGRIDAAQVSISLPHRPQASQRIYEEKLGARLSFGNGTGIAFKFDGSWLDRPNLYLGSATTKVAGGDVTSALTADTAWLDDEALLEAISRLIESAALSGALSLADAARSLGLSPRSLQRRLATLGTSFEAHVDAWRSRQARLYLADAAGLPIGAIARALGYGHPAHFVRAFRRWEGQTPLAFRRAAAIEAQAGAKW